MLQCKDCEYFEKSPTGEVAFKCDPFINIKEPECLQKWQLIKVNQMVASYQQTLRYYDRFAPMQEKMFKMMENEIEDMEESNRWKNGYDEEDGFDEDDNNDEFYEDPDAWKNS